MVLIFAVSAMLGWIYEMIAVSIHKKRIAPRGLLVGPFLPIYGFGALVIITATHNVTDSPLAVFLVGMAVATAFEYLSAWLLEKIFKMSWWSYDEFKINYKGIIALAPSLVWGFASLLAIYVLWPLLQDLDGQLFERFGVVPYIVFTVCIVADMIFSAVHVAKFRAYSTQVRKSWEKDGELDTAKYMRYLYREIRSRTPLFSIRNFVMKTAPERLKDAWPGHKKKQ